MAVAQEVLVVEEQFFEAGADDVDQAQLGLRGGGGGAAALSGAMGAALVSMVCNLTIGRKKYAAVDTAMQEILDQSEQLRAELTALVAADAVAFEAVMAAYALPKATAEEQAARNVAIQAAIQHATIVPLETARACAQVIALAKPAVEMGNTNVISDAGAGVLSALAGLKTAALNVLINLGTITDETFVATHRAELEQILADHESLAEEVYNSVKSKF